MPQEPKYFVKELFENALREKAGDIFFLPSRETCNIRVRIDGIDKNITEVPEAFGRKCISHIKARAGLLTYRTNISQDGVIRDVGEGNIELRVSTFPSLFGERVAIRILEEKSSEDYLEDLGFQIQITEALKKLILQPSGLIILTGPTGSGKTTTIYAMIRELLRNSLDPATIITIEDPIECVIDGISQTSVSKENDEWNYAEALRAALRQNVKTLLIGEMRDKEVVKVALDAALTGHRVITTYHAGDIPAVFARMLHQGFEPFLIASAVTGVVTQRLIRAKKCNVRKPVAAILQTDDKWKDFIASAPPLYEVRKRLTEQPMADLAGNATELADNGIITEYWRLEI